MARSRAYENVRDPVNMPCSIAQDEKDQRDAAVLSGQARSQRKPDYCRWRGPRTTNLLVYAGDGHVK